MAESAASENKSSLDCRGLFCPVPVIRVAKALREAQPGEVVELLADDPGVVGDMEAWSRGTGNRILSQETLTGAVFKFRVEKGKGGRGRRAV